MGGAALILIILAFVTLWTFRRHRRRHREARRQEVHPFSESAQILTYLHKLKRIKRIGSSQPFILKPELIHIIDSKSILV